jgi:DNA-directed RNA polymerase subunit N (RpoN/RPB10)
MSRRVLPVRCFACGRLLCNMQKAFETRCLAVARSVVHSAVEAREDGGGAAGEFQRCGQPSVGAMPTQGDILDELGIHTSCCRRILMCTVVDARLVRALKMLGHNRRQRPDGAFGACMLTPWFPVQNLTVEELGSPDGVFPIPAPLEEGQPPFPAGCFLVLNTLLGCVYGRDETTELLDTTLA